MALEVKVKRITTVFTAHPEGTMNVHPNPKIHHSC